ncbi:MAG: tetratricopeptide repeat protein [Gammaproteobacteria bacterium]|nr:tetratricopeptide repeat protein [Gammaproteobacteria bacterium]MDH4254769.1 tetratricopeptide repeat protein [Gammaproteobacteria bacterium]MDH5308319.1 tetratricopeptide repeat protein [Gammaproteobacteria bacterium]
MKYPSNHSTRSDNWLAVAAMAAATAFGLTGCATPVAKKPQARIEIQEEIGFTITEESPADAEIREDYQAALAFLEQERFGQGIERLELVVEQAPELSGPLIDLGIAYHQKGDLAAAESALVKALTVNPEHPIAHNELGIIYRKTGRFREARASYERALAVYPGFHYARRNLAVLCDLYLADTSCALDNYEAYMKTVPEDNEAAIWITDLRNRTGR